MQLTSRTSIMIKASIALLLGLGSVITLAAWSEAPQTPGMRNTISPSPQPASQPATQPTTEQSAAQQEREDVLKFIHEYMPMRSRMIDRMLDRPAGQKIMQRMTERYRRLMRLQSEDPELYEISIKQIKLQDDVFTMVRRDQREGIDPSADDQLKPKVRELVDLSLQERQRRIDRLEKMLAEQKASLERDKAAPDALVDKHIKQMTQDAERLGPLQGGPGMRGPRGR